MSSEEEEDRRRGHRDRRREVWAQVEGWAIKAVGIIGIVALAITAVLILCIVVRWLGITFRTPQKVEDLMKNAVWTALIAGSTAWASGFLKRDT